MSEYFNNTSSIDEWHNKRRSRFTASENYKLLIDASKGGFGAGAVVYIETKVIELCTVMYDRPELDEIKSLRHGKAFEYPAYEHYVHETKNYGMTYMGTETPVFIPDPEMVEESGGTPDVANILSDSSIDYLCEIKCPINPAYHFRRLTWQTQWDVKENYIQCYTQMQNLIKITGAFGCDFISYDERQLSKKNQIKIIEVKPDHKFINNLELRLLLAIKDKYKLLSKHMGTELKNRTDYINFLKQ